MISPRWSPTVSEIVIFPAGLHQAHPSNTAKLHTLIDEESFDRLARSFSALPRDPAPWIDYDHQGFASAGEVVGLRWDASRGICAAIRWSFDGERAVCGGMYRYFSPHFWSCDETLRPKGFASACIGGITNRPGYRGAMPRIVPPERHPYELDTLGASDLAALNLNSPCE